MVKREELILRHAATRFQGWTVSTNLKQCKRRPPQHSTGISALALSKAHILLTGTSLAVYLISFTQIQGQAREQLTASRKK